MCDRKEAKMFRDFQAREYERWGDAQSTCTQEDLSSDPQHPPQECTPVIPALGWVLGKADLQGSLSTSIAHWGALSLATDFSGKIIRR